MYLVILSANVQGDFKVHEDKKHRAKYQALGDSEKKMQFFSARQIACRLLGSRYYLCQKVCGAIVELHVSSGIMTCSSVFPVPFFYITISFMYRRRVNLL